MELNLEFPVVGLGGGGLRGCKTKKPSTGGVWIFSGTIAYADLGDSCIKVPRVIRIELAFKIRNLSAALNLISLHPSNSLLDPSYSF